MVLNYYTSFLMSVKSRRVLMGRREFELVFAPSSSIVQEKCDKHQKSAKACLVILAGMVLGAAACLYLLMGPVSESFAETLGAQFALGGLVIEVIIAIGTLIALGYHSYKAEHFANVLDTEYVDTSCFGRSYN